MLTVEIRGILRRVWLKLLERFLKWSLCSSFALSAGFFSPAEAPVADLLTDDGDAVTLENELGDEVGSEMGDAEVALSGLWLAEKEGWRLGSLVGVLMLPAGYWTEGECGL